MLDFFAYTKLTWNARKGFVDFFRKFEQRFVFVSFKNMFVARMLPKKNSRRTIKVISNKLGIMNKYA